MEELLTATTVRKRLGISRQTLWQLIQNKEISVIRLSKNGKGRMRFKPEEIEKFIKERTA